MNDQMTHDVAETPSPLNGERIRRRGISRLEPLNRSRRRESALISWSERVRELTSAATRFRGRETRILWRDLSSRVGDPNRGAEILPFHEGEGRGEGERGVGKSSGKASLETHEDRNGLEPFMVSSLRLCRCFLTE